MQKTNHGITSLDDIASPELNEFLSQIEKRGNYKKYLWWGALFAYFGYRGDPHIWHSISLILLLCSIWINLWHYRALRSSKFNIDDQQAWELVDESKHLQLLDVLESQTEYAEVYARIIYAGEELTRGEVDFLHRYDIERGGHNSRLFREILYPESTPNGAEV